MGRGGGRHRSCTLGPPIGSPGAARTEGSWRGCGVEGEGVSGECVGSVWSGERCEGWVCEE